MQPVVVTQTSDARQRQVDLLWVLRLPWATDLLQNSQSYTKKLSKKQKPKKIQKQKKQKQTNKKTKNKNKTAQNMLKNSKDA